ncbi:CopG family ribbon-helix-helix protein [Serratia ficaria]|uniref:CopG family ribbon-helix-helix protein n=1 Tax=Serratia ficaria TaxID=61651 RepID=UPI00077C1EDF|nr:ribbon-helix-helix protein, CopG family [Serratia ficaria]
MAIKKPSERRLPGASEAQADALANKLADRPYGVNRESPPEVTKPESMTRTTISLPEALLRRLEDLALDNKRAGVAPKNVSSIIREALEGYLK